MVRFPSLLLAALLAAILSALQILFVRFTSIYGIVPDLVLILAVWVALQSGQFTAVLFGFGAGLMMDFITGDVPGTNALAKMAAGFLAGFFYGENKVQSTLGGYPVLLVMLLCAVVHNVVYFFFHLRLTEMTFDAFVLRYGAASALYTTVLTIIPMLITARRAERVRF
jgi:rod shape-determining protein MreD